MRRLSLGLERWSKALFERPDYSDYSDEYVVASAFHMRALVSDDPWAIDSNDRSTPLGAFCWVVLSVRLALFSWVESSFMGSLQFLRLWHVEQEAAERGLELTWDTGPVMGYMPSFERVLEKALAPPVRETVFAPGLPQVLRPWAEALYVLLEEWSALPVVDVPRPTVDDFLSADGGSPYRGFEGITAEEIAWIWPWDSEIMLSTEAIDCELPEENEPRWGRLADLYEE